MEIKPKINKWDLIKFLCTAKKTTDKTKRQTKEREKIFANSKIYKQLMGLSIKKTSNSIKKWADDITSHQSEQRSSKNLQTINAGESVDQKEASYTVGGNVNWFTHYGKL